MDDNKTAGKPFSIGYVLQITVKHIRKSIDISIGKTFERISEFSDDREKSEEIFKCLSDLHSLRKTIDTFQSNNSEHFKKR